MTAVVASDELVEAWTGRRGIAGFLTAVNHKDIGARFVVTACAFLAVGGIEALVIRSQLARPDGRVLGPEAYNQAFTMHGTTMMFLFAIPVLEGIAMYVAPLMLGTRDMPFPRLNAFGFWTYLFGALLLHAGFLTGTVPDGGWFAYVPLTSSTFSPGSNLDIWLIGVTFVEVSGIVGALELVVLILRHRAPGMALGRMPLFIWSVLVMAAMMLLAFPAVVAASLLLELERKFGLPFFDPSRGGNPLLWQHLFWIFGHPEVYIMLLPATGIVSTVVAVNARRRIVGYPLVVAALVTIAFLSFGLWVHHMFSVGIPIFALGLFSVASSAIAIPSGVQVFAWLATMLQGRPRWNTPMLFVVGFLLTFVAGGITGVMVAAVPFDWQAHDSFFVVAHFHYVLIGGVVFPIFGALHHWFPKLTGRMPSERLGRVAFWLTFTGFHVTFFPQHILGLLGMPRRVYTYSPGEGLSGYNLVSTAGSFLLGAGVVLFFANLARAWRAGQPAPDDPWGTRSGEAGTFEWHTSSPPPAHNFTNLPVALDGEPPAAESHGHLERVLSGLASPAGPRREQLVTTWSAAVPEAVVGLSGPSYWPLAASAAMAVALAALLVDSGAFAAAGAVAGVVALVGWLDPRQAARDATTPRPLSDEAAPVTASSVWALGAGLAASAAVLGFVIYAYYYLALGEGPWPPVPHGPPPLGRSLPVVLVAVVLGLAGVALGRGEGRSRGAFFATAAVALGLFVLEVREIQALGLAGDESAYAAAVVALVGFAAVAAAAAAVVVVMAGARLVADSARSAAQVGALVSLFAAGCWISVWFVAYVTAQS